MLKNGEEIGSYKITGELGRGGMGVVYRAHDKVLQRDAALKMVLPEAVTPNSKRRFLREAAAIARCDHPGIIKVYSFGEHEGLPYMAMEFVDGKTLLSYLELARAVHNAGDMEELRRYGYIQEPSPEDEDLPYFLRPLTGPPLPDPDYENRAAYLLAGVADALYEAHSLGILHRDIKPSNILIGRKGPPKLADFGLAKFSDSSDITTGQPMMGTLRYMAPENFSGGEASAASDIYSLGTVLYELMTLEHPFKADNTAAFIKAVTQDKCVPPSKVNPSISPALGLVIMKCLEKAPARRFKDARELADAIRLAARPKGIKTQIVDGIRGMLKSSPEEEKKAQAAAPVSEANRREARRLAGEAALVYFVDFSVNEAATLVNDAVGLDPLSVDANAMVAVLRPHLGEAPIVRKAAARMRQAAKTGRSPEERLHAGLLAGFFFGEKDWQRNIEHYLKGGEEDPALLSICARARMMAGDHERARDYAARIDAAIPGPSLFTWFVEAYHNSWMGRFDEWHRLTAEEIRHHPGNIMLRFALTEGLLHAGRLDEAETTINEAAALAKDHDFIPVMRADLAVLRGDYKQACIEIRKTIGGRQEEEISGLYYRLSKLYSLRGDRKEALRHLAIARNLGPEFNYKTTDELKAVVEGNLEYRPAFPELPEPCLQLNHENAKRAALDSALSCRHGVGLPHSTVYVFSPDAEPAAVRAWLPFNESHLAAQDKARIFLPALPLSSFLDARGTPLRADFTRVQSEYGRYGASVVYSSPLRQLSLTQLETRLNLEGLWARRQGGVIDLRLDEVNHRPGWRAHILALPQDSEISELSDRADEETKKEGWRFLIFRRFFFDCEHFRLKARIRHKRV
ncbi:MAG: hypothetical protein A2X31_06900 [Elusimicrobia bacterium GWB2_63_22]|nr:MAG: hypothetical protein A2X31_06900 [Elusimicrobia bacterium GWB2_63_22]